jgi:hypothetical protein
MQRLESIWSKGTEAGCIGHLGDFDHMMPIRRDAAELARSQSVGRLTSRIIRFPNLTAHFKGHLAVFI